MAKVHVQIFELVHCHLPEELQQFVMENGLMPAWSSAALSAVAAHSTFTMRLACAERGGRFRGLMCATLRGITRPRYYASHGDSVFSPILECSLPLTSAPGLAFARDACFAERRELVRNMERALFQKCQRWPLVSAYRNLREEHLALFGGNLHIAFKRGPTAIIANLWKDFKEYMQSLPRVRRRQFDRMLSANNQNADQKFFVTSKIDPVQAAHLSHLNKLKNTTGKPTPPPPIGYFEAMNQDERALYLGYVDKEGKLLCFDLAMTDEMGWLHTTIVGSLQSVNVRRSMLYFDMYLREIQYMIENDLPAIDFGVGFWDLKSHYGCSASATHLVLRPRWMR